MSDIEAIYTWTEIDDKGDEGTMACVVPEMPQLGIMIMMTRRLDLAEGPFRRAADLHRERTGHKVRLVKWTNRETIVTL